MDRGWNDPTRLTRFWNEAPPSLRVVLKHLAHRPTRASPIEEVAEVAFGRGDPEGRRRFLRLLLRLQPQMMDRYAITTWPFRARWNAQRQTVEYLMRPDVALKVRGL